MKRSSSLGFGLFCIAVIALVSPAWAESDPDNVLPNGDFDTKGSEMLGWVSQGAEVVPSPTGSGSAIYIPAGGRFETTEIPASFRLSVEFDFACERPAGGAGGFIVDLRGGGAPVILLQMMPTGKIAVSAGDHLAYPLPEVTFSEDVDENHSLVDGGDDARVAHLKIEHDGTQDPPTLKLSLTTADGKVSVTDDLHDYADAEGSRHGLYHLLFIVPQNTAGVTIDNVRVLTKK